MIFLLWPGDHSSFLPQHFLYFLPLPHEKVGSGSGDDAAQNEDVVTEDAAYDTGIDGDTSGDYVDADGGDMAEEEAGDVVIEE